MVIDASLWVSALVVHAIHHVRSREWLAAHVGADDRLAVPSLALVEVAGAIARRTGVEELGRQAAEAIRTVPGLDIVGLDAESAMEAARIAAAWRLRGADAVYVALARLLNVPLVTLDQEIEERAGGIIRIIRP